MQQMTKSLTEDQIIIKAASQGLWIYIAQKKLETADKEGIAELHKVAEDMEIYWGTDNIGFSIQEESEKIGKPIGKMLLEAMKEIILLGLGKYADELMLTHGNEEKVRIEAIKRVMHQIEKA